MPPASQGSYRLARISTSYDLRAPADLPGDSAAAAGAPCPGAPLGFSLHRGQSASLFLAVVSDGAPDTLTSIDAPGTATSVTLPAGGITVRDQHPVLLTGPRPAAFLTTLTRSVPGGTDVKIVLNFRNAGPVTLVGPVMARAAHYVTYGTPPSPTPSVSPTKHHGRFASPGMTLPPSPSPSASPTPTH